MTRLDVSFLLETQKLYFSENCRFRAPSEVLTTPVGVLFW
jgi:hypothetical protein